MDSKGDEMEERVRDAISMEDNGKGGSEKENEWNAMVHIRAGILLQKCINSVTAKVGLLSC